MDNLTTRQLHLLFSLLGVFFFIPFLGSVHLFDWDEINFAESAREMLVSGNFGQVQVNFEPFWEKPPLFIWLQAACMKLFGISEFSARLPNALVGIATLNVLVFYGKKFANQTLALLWPLVYLASITPQFYFHTGIIDPLFNLFIFLGLMQIYQTFNQYHLKHWLLAGLFLGLAILTKGPVAGLVTLLVLMVLFVKNKFKPWMKLSHFLLYGITALAVSAVWFLPETLKNGFGFLSNFLVYQIDLMQNPVASHGQPWFYHPVVLLIGCFPASVLGLRLVFKKTELSFESLMRILFWVVLILFSLVTTKIVHYSSLCYLPLTFLAAKRLSTLKEKPLVHYEKFFIWLVSVLWVIIFLAVPIIGLNRLWLAEKVNSTFIKELLSVASTWGISQLLVGLLSMAVLAFWLYAVIWKQSLIKQSLFILSAYLVLFMITIIPNIERHTQGSIIEFYKSMEQEDCYIETYKFKSYAQYFYTKVKPLVSSDNLYLKREEWLSKLDAKTRLDLNENGRGIYQNEHVNWFLYQNTDKPVYLICMPHKAFELDENPQFEPVGNYGGYRVYKKESRP
ncbi:MAG: glycosyltransferase family 39 protein [Flavobacteriales bacterium]|nr:glycosyltransferase family 39 protein [Flavobacteriales bacterium]